MVIFVTLQLVVFLIRIKAIVVDVKYLEAIRSQCKSEECLTIVNEFPSIIDNDYYDVEGLELYLKYFEVALYKYEIDCNLIGLLKAEGGMIETAYKLSRLGLKGSPQVHTNTAKSVLILSSNAKERILLGWRSLLEHKDFHQATMLFLNLRRLIAIISNDHREEHFIELIKQIEIQRFSSLEYDEFLNIVKRCALSIGSSS